MKYILNTLKNFEIMVSKVEAHRCKFTALTNARGEEYTLLDN